MSARSAPVGWEVTSGTWSTDLDRDTTTVLTGAYSIVLKSGKSPTIYSPWARVNIPVAEGAVDTPNTEASSLSVYARYQVDRITTGDLVDIKLHLYSQTRTEIGTGTSLKPADNTEAPTANDWYTAGVHINNITTAIAWARVSITKANTAFNLYVDSIVIERGPTVGWMLRDANQSIPTATWTDVAFDTVEGLVETDYSTTNNELQFNVPGDYAIHATVTFDSLGSGSQARAKIIDENGFTLGTISFFTQSAAAAAVFARTTLHCSAIYFQARYSRGIRLQVYHTNGSDMDINDAHIMAYRIGR